MAAEEMKQRAEAEIATRRADANRDMDRRSIERWLKRLACAAFAVALAVGFADALSAHSTAAL